MSKNDDLRMKMPDPRRIPDNLSVRATTLMSVLDLAIDKMFKKIEYDNFDIITKYVSEYKLVSTEESSNDEVSKISKVSSSLENYYLNISGAFNETTEISEFTIYIPDELVLSTIYSSSSSKEIYMQIVAAIVTILRFYFGCIKFVMDFVNNNLSLYEKAAINDFDSFDIDNKTQIERFEFITNYLIKNKAYMIICAIIDLEPELISKSKEILKCVCDKFMDNAIKAMEYKESKYLKKEVNNDAAE